jgi:hypothetical protein
VEAMTMGTFAVSIEDMHLFDTPTELAIRS